MCYCLVRLFFCGGGGLCGSGCGVNHFDAQVYKPPYLFDWDGVEVEQAKIVHMRSVPKFVDGQHPDDINVPVGSSFTIKIEVKGALVEMWAMVRFGSATHSVNTDQRRVPLFGKQQSGNVWEVKTPVESGVVTPGFWLLVAIDGDGVPSEGQKIFCF